MRRRAAGRPGSPRPPRAPPPAEQPGAGISNGASGPGPALTPELIYHQAAEDAVLAAAIADPRLDPEVLEAAIRATPPARAGAVDEGAGGRRAGRSGGRAGATAARRPRRPDPPGDPRAADRHD